MGVEATDHAQHDGRHDQKSRQGQHLQRGFTAGDPSGEGDDPSV